MAMVKSGDFTFAFPTIILRRPLSDVGAMNERLLEEIHAERNRSPGIRKSNVKAWHSDMDWFQKSGEPGVTEFRSRLRKAIHEYWLMDQQKSQPDPDMIVQLSGWAMVYDKGAYSVPHVHPNSNFSGVYYVDEGDFQPDADPLHSDPNQSKSGYLSLIDPRASAMAHSTEGFGRATSMDFPAKTGTLLIFPAWLMHHVHPYEGDRPRVALSFNVSVHKKNGPAPHGGASPT